MRLSSVIWFRWPSTGPRHLRSPSWIILLLGCQAQSFRGLSPLGLFIQVVKLAPSLYSLSGVAVAEDGRGLRGTFMHGGGWCPAHDLRVSGCQGDKLI
ncbi:hypothetical protein BDV18DRAFT_128857 [Aspergillus unguis]